VFLANACAGHDALRKEVESLLAHHEARGFMDPSQLDGSLATTVEETSPLPAGARPDPLVGRMLSHYRIDAPLGSGGMGAVYRATDVSLARGVAIKVLPHQLASMKRRKRVSFARRGRQARSTIPTSAPSTKLESKTASCSSRWPSTKARR
jgi:serine/threonine protein kinase